MNNKSVGSKSFYFMSLFHKDILEMSKRYYSRNILFASIWEVRARKGLIVPAAGGRGAPPPPWAPGPLGPGPRCPKVPGSLGPKPQGPWEFSKAKSLGPRATCFFTP